MIAFKGSDTRFAVPEVSSERAAEAYQVVRSGSAPVAVVKEACRREGEPQVYEGEPQVHDMLIVNKASLDGHVRRMEDATEAAAAALTLAGTIVTGAVSGVLGAAAGIDPLHSAWAGAAVAGIGIPFISGSLLQRELFMPMSRTGERLLDALTTARDGLFAAKRVWPDYHGSFHVPEGGGTNRLHIWFSSAKPFPPDEVGDAILGVKKGEDGVAIIPEAAETQFRIKKEDIVIANKLYYDWGMMRRAEGVAEKTFLRAAGTTALAGAGAAIAALFLEGVRVIDAAGMGLGVGAILTAVYQITNASSRE